MSRVVSPVGPSSVLELLKYGDTIDVLPWTTMWWRQRLYPGEDGNVAVTELDDPQNPTRVTITWWDHYGPDDDEIEPYATKVTHKEPETALFAGPPVRLLARNEYFLDVLWHSRPTAGRWEPLTAPGRHVHPDDRAFVDELQREQFLSTIGLRR